MCLILDAALEAILLLLQDWLVIKVKGKIYALDINSQALKKLEYKALRERLDNIETIKSDGRTPLPDNSMDVILLYDVYHDLNDKFQVLKELYRLLKPKGILSFSDHHLEKEMILSELTGTGLFKLKEKNRKTLSFYKNVH
jgi:ubiquinone/menaquinone biosynthesis C-methylase UbiE